MLVETAGNRLGWRSGVIGVLPALVVRLVNVPVQNETDTVLRIITKSGSFNLIPCTVALNESVQMQEGQINRVKAVFNGNNRAVRYAS